MQVGAVDLRPLAQGGGTLQDVFQLAHVARKGIALQSRQGRGRQRQPLAARHARQQIGRQRRDVLRPVAQRRHGDFDDVDAVVEVLAYAPVAHQGGQILVRGAQHARVDRYFLTRTDRAHGPLLQRPQQLDLHGRRHGADFVQEQRAAGGGLEQALAVGAGAGEAALDVPEQLAFEQMLRDGAAVDRHERPAGARALGVDQARHALLADTRLAADEHRRLAARELGDHDPQRLHGRRIADQAWHGAGLGAYPRQPQRLIDQAPQGLHVDRLVDEIEGAGLHRRHRRADIAVGGDHGHRQLRLRALDVLDQLEAAAVRQAQVAQAQAVACVGQGLLGGGQRAGAVALQAHAAQGDGQQLAQVRLVIDDQHPRRVFGKGVHVSCPRRRSASTMRKPAPPAAGV